MSTIPKITRAHVLAAFKRINAEGVPARRTATEFFVRFRGNRYPPKYVVSLAARCATGRLLPPDAFSGGAETNDVLRSLGFEVERRRSGSKELTLQPRRGTVPIVRIAVRGRTRSLRAASNVLLTAFRKRWPHGIKATFTITPGGFAEIPFPDEWTGNAGWESRTNDLELLRKRAERAIRRVLSPRVLAAARARTRFMTIGLDLMGDAEHAELVAVVDCRSGSVIRWTGKSYPTMAQTRRLVQVTDLGSHLLRIGGDRVLILGCHDLNMFSARAIANQNPLGERRRRCNEMRLLARRFKPTVVLQHPHSTDTPNIWRMPWACLTRDLPSVASWASGVGYHAWGARPRRTLKDVLAGTKSYDVLDVVVDS